MDEPCAFYWCPTAKEFECSVPGHGGFSVCCAHPELHMPVDGDNNIIEQVIEHPLHILGPSGANVEPHEFKARRGLWNRLRGICNHCYAPRSLHPRDGWVRARPLGDNTYLSANAPHFEEGW